MAAETVLESELHAVEHELRGVAEVVVPGDQRVADHDVALAQDPVGEVRLVGDLRRVDLDSRDLEYPRAVAADREARPLDHELLEAKLHQRERRP